MLRKKICVAVNYTMDQGSHKGSKDEVPESKTLNKFISNQ